MLLERIQERNPAMVEAAVLLHQRGELPTASWLYDLDAVAHNARCIAAEARRLGLTTYAMTKQHGRNPMVTAVALSQGLDKTVSVDIQCAKLLNRYRLPIGHVGHLNQIPRAEMADALAMRPDVVTVFSREAARRVSDVAAGMGVSQDLLLRVHKPGDVFFPGQEGGFLDDDLIGAAHEIQGMPGVAIVGVTTFPCLTYDFSGRREVSFNPNMRTITAAAERLRCELGIGITQINAPGNTSTATMAMLREGGATHVEPGHGILGTTPAQIVEANHPEIPAYVFVTEISHRHDGRGYGIAGGGLWTMMGKFLDPDWSVGAFVGSDPATVLGNRLDYEHIDQIIDYHIPLTPGDRCQIGDTVVFPTYTQAHMTRALVVPVSGISTGAPVVRGVFDSAATMLTRGYDPVAPAEVMRLIDELLTEYPVPALV